MRGAAAGRAPRPSAAATPTPASTWAARSARLRAAACQPLVGVEVAVAAGQGQPVRLALRSRRRRPRPRGTGRRPSGGSAPAAGSPSGRRPRGRAGPDRTAWPPRSARRGSGRAGSRPPAPWPAARARPSPAAAPAARVDLLDRRGEHDVDALALAHAEVGLERARVAVEVLAGPELERVDEDRGDDRAVAGVLARRRGSGWRGLRAGRPSWARTPTGGRRARASASSVPARRGCGRGPGARSRAAAGDCSAWPWWTRRRGDRRRRRRAARGSARRGSAAPGRR